MVFELAHTSTSSGIDPGSSGFTSVVRTSGISREMRRLLEGLSSYKPDGTPPMPVFGHRVASVAGIKHHVISLIRPNGIDHSGRDNRLAWHVVFSPDDTEKLHVIDAIDWLIERADGWDGIPKIETANPVITPVSQSAVSRTPDIWSKWDCHSDWSLIIATLGAGSERTCITVPDDIDLKELTRSIYVQMAHEESWKSTICAGTDGSSRRSSPNTVIVHEGSNAARRANAGIDRKVIRLPTDPQPFQISFAQEDNQSEPARLPAGSRGSSASHRYLFEDDEIATSETTEDPIEVSTHVLPTAEPSPAVSKTLIILVTLGIVAVLGLIAIIIT